uniref:Uncharacterized protein n=1 Tax=Zea mays TaxID=4577 RepID=B6UAD4_MAIZE|nr:hypothetical protein [Zea mays]
MEDGGKAPAGLGTLRAVLAILQWWGFNVTVIIMNKWIFQKLDFKFPLTVSCGSGKFSQSLDDGDDVEIFEQ